MTIQYQGVWSLQSAAQLQSTQRWVTDPLYKNTTLLLQADDAANAAQNNTFLDSSSNAFSITRNGNTTQGSFTPFSLQPGAWGNYLDASSTLSYTQPALGSVFTLEFWTWPSSIVSGALLYVASSNAPLIGYAGGILSVGQQGAWLITSSTNPTPNQWNHIAVVREGTGSNQLKLYLNGVLTGTGTSATTITSQSATIGGSGLVAYISNLRVVDGTAIYTSNFTPPIAPFTAIAGTVLLTCQSNRFIDANTQVAAKTITTSGTPSIQAFSPFAPQYQWTSSVIGGSGYFDGTGDYLSVAGSTVFNSTGDLTLEAWCYITSASAFGGIFSMRRSLDADGLGITINNTGNFEITIDPGGVVTTPVPLNQWNHVALVRSGSATNNCSAYLNGTRIGQFTANNQANMASNVAVIGRYYADGTNQYWTTGYISNVRYVVGQALYSGATITVPTAPLTTTSQGAIATNVQLLANFTNAGIYDGTMKNNLETVGNAQISTAVVKYGSGSLAFDGTGDWLLLPHSPDQFLSTGQFTIEMWVYRNASAAYGLVAKGTGTTGWLVSLNSSNQVVFTFTTSTITSSGAVAASTWTHIAVVREATGTNQTKIYINGVNDGQGTVATDFNQTNAMYVGADRTGGSAFNGYIDDLRITKGIARYTQNFIPPSVALPRQ